MTWEFEKKYQSSLMFLQGIEHIFTQFTPFPFVYWLMMYKVLLSADVDWPVASQRLAGRSNQSPRLRQATAEHRENERNEGDEQSSDTMWCYSRSLTRDTKEYETFCTAMSNLRLKSRVWLLPHLQASQHVVDEGTLLWTVLPKRWMNML